MKKNILSSTIIFRGLILFLIVFSLGFTSAEVQTLGTFQIDSDIELIQLCSNCSYVNITSILYPNSSIMLKNLEMTKDGSNYNYTLTSNYPSALGKYIINGIGDLDGEDESWSYDLEITKTGKILNISDSISYLILIVGALFIFLLCLWGGIVLPFKNNRNGEGEIISIEKLKYFKVGLLFLSYVFFVWVLNLLFSLSNNFDLLQSYTKFFEVIFSVVNAMSYPIFVFMLIIMGMLFWKDLQLKKLLERGLNPE